MTFDEFIQDGLGKANRLFEKLAQSGPNAVKTRERLFVDLKAELSHLSRFERNHLIPALGDQRKTRPLVKALEKDNEKVDALLAELEIAPRAGEAFLLKLAELQAAFQAHVRDERKALLPAVLDALHAAQKAEKEAAEAAAREAAELAAAELRAAEIKAEALAAAEAAEAAEAEAAETKAAEEKAHAEAKAAAEAHRATEAPPPPVETEPHAMPAAAPEPTTVVEAESEPVVVPLATPAPLAAITMLHTIAPALTPPLAKAAEALKPLATPLPTPVYGAQVWANLMQEAAAGAVMGYRLMMAYSNNAGFAALQTRLMKEQLELMTKSGYKMMEAAQRFARTSSSS